jgi:Holliday junction DNA helicase RuvA
MISRLKGLLLTNDLERVEIETPSGVVYEVEVPLTVIERMPRTGAEIELRTLQVVREDSVALYGFLEANERELFKRLLTASGVGPKLALAMLSALSAPRLARALADKDLAALTQVSGVGKKKAEKISLELSDKVDDLAVATGGKPASPAAQEAVQALVALGYSFGDADHAVRAAMDDGAVEGTEELIRKALAQR